MNVVLIGTALCIAVQLAIGLLASRKVATQNDYLLAGRRLGYPLATFSIFATWFGAETCIGSAGAVYTEGLSATSSDPFGYAGCLFLMGFVFAAPLWRRNLTTIADLFRQRYSPGVERMAAILMIPTSVLWAAAQVRAFGQILAASTGMAPAVSITIAAGVVILYTGVGGLLADAVTDFVQGILVAAGLLAILWFTLTAGGGAGAILSGISTERLQLFGGAQRPLLGTLEAWAIPICGSVIAQELISRVLASRSPQVAARSSLMGGGIYLVLGAIPVFVALAAPGLGIIVENPEQLLPVMAQRLLPPFFYALFIGALMSAILSTVDSCLLSASGIAVNNLVAPLAPTLSDKTLLRLSRGGVALAGILAWGLALNSQGVLALVEEASAFGSAGIFVTMTLGLFTRFGGARAAGAAIASGAAVWADQRQSELRGDDN